MFVLTDHSAVSVDFCDVSIDFEVLLTFLMFLLTLNRYFYWLSIDFSDVFIDFEHHSNVSTISIDFEDYSNVSI